MLKNQIGWIILVAVFAGIVGSILVAAGRHDRRQVETAAAVTATTLAAKSASDAALLAVSTASKALELASSAAALKASVVALQADIVKQRADIMAVQVAVDSRRSTYSKITSVSRSAAK